MNAKHQNKILLQISDRPEDAKNDTANASVDMSWSKDNTGYANVSWIGLWNGPSTTIRYPSTQVDLLLALSVGNSRCAFSRNLFAFSCSFLVIAFRAILMHRSASSLFESITEMFTYQDAHKIRQQRSSPGLYVAATRRLFRAATIDRK